MSGDIELNSGPKIVYKLLTEFFGDNTFYGTTKTRHSDESILQFSDKPINPHGCKTIHSPKNYQPALNMPLLKKPSVLC